MTDTVGDRSLERRIEIVRQQAADIWQDGPTDEPQSGEPQIPQSFRELQAILEELLLSEEGLRRQNEELTNAR